MGDRVDNGTTDLSNVEKFVANCPVPDIMVLPHLSCSTIDSLVRKEKQKEYMFSLGAFYCIRFPFLYPASR